MCIRLTWNLTGSCGQQQSLRGWSCMMVKQFQDGGQPPFWKSIYRHFSVKNGRIFMKFCTQQQISNWMNVTWSKIKKSCIGQTPSSTERISCLLRQLRTCYTPCQRGYDFERPQMKNRTFQGNLFQQVFFNILNSTVLVTSRHVFWCFSCKYMPLSCVYGRWWGWRRWWWWSKTISN